MAITQTITALPTPAPLRTQAQEIFDAAMAAWVAAWPGNITEVNTWATQANALAAALNVIAAGGAMSIPYTFSTTTTDADPGAGFLRLDNATQNTATTIRADLAGSDGSTWTDVLNTFDDSTSAIKGYILLQKTSDATKWLLFSVSALASPSGYKNITVANVASSAASPFANNDSIILKFTRNGDKGDTGTNAGLAYTYSNNTDATDPTSGKLKFDNTTLASATKLYISETDANTNSIAAELATWDDSTSTVKGTLKVTKSTDPTKFAIFQITGSVTDNGTWDTFNLTYMAGAGTLADTDAVTVTLYRTGDAGTSGVGNHEVALRTGNGHGSTNTKIRRFTTTEVNVGSAITYADSAANGASLTVNADGLYAIHYVDSSSGTANIGVSKNSAQLTTNIDSITAATRVFFATAPANIRGGVSRVVSLVGGDVIRPHTDGSNDGTSDQVFFAIRKVGVV